jgi:hypothetical protein
MSSEDSSEDVGELKTTTETLCSMVETDDEDKNDPNCEERGCQNESEGASTVRNSEMPDAFCQSFSNRQHW